MLSQSYDADNIFVKILRGEIPARKASKDDTTLAIMNIMPRSRVTQRRSRLCRHCLQTVLFRPRHDGKRQAEAGSYCEHPDAAA
jgi:hypothetical protein